MIGQGTFKIYNLSFCIRGTVKSSVILTTTGAIFERMSDNGAREGAAIVLETWLPVDSLDKNVPYILIMEVY